MTTTKKQALCNTAEAEKAIRLIVGDGVTELRALEATTAGNNYRTTFAGYFDDARKLAEAVQSIQSAKGIYFVPNAVDPALLARSNNRIQKASKGSNTQDTDIHRRRWLLIDCDAQRPSGISATDAEHGAAIQRCRDVMSYLRGIGWTDPIAADSGNGGHLLYHIDLPGDDDGVVERCLKALAAQFDDGAVVVDTTVHNPSRIWKLYGTRACKGDSTEERPHRMAKILYTPDAIKTVPEELLQELAAEHVEAAMVRESYKGNGEAFDVAEFIARHGFDVDGPHDWNGRQGHGQKWTFNTSPMCEHHGDGPYLTQHASGAISAGCQHNSCSWGWADLRNQFEPKAAARAKSPNRPKPDVKPEQRKRRDVIVPYQPFPVDVLPETLREFVQSHADAIVCDPAIVALPLLAGLAGSIGATRSIHVNDIWYEQSVLWFAIASVSGSQKTPAQEAALRPLEEAQAFHIDQEKEALDNYELDKRLYDEEMKKWTRATSKGETVQAPDKTQEPTTVRYIVDNTTIESLAVRLHENPRGLLVATDELSSWLGNMGRYSNGKSQGEKGQWLSMYRAGRLLVDRKTGDTKTIHVRNAAVSICGGIPPRTLRKEIAGADMDNGLVPQITIVSPPPPKFAYLLGSLPSFPSMSRGVLPSRR